MAPAAEATGYGGTVMSTEITRQARVLTSVELLDAAVWREIGSGGATNGGSVCGGARELGWALAPGSLDDTGHGSHDR
jgi:hypothetical protein